MANMPSVISRETILRQKAKSVYHRWLYTATYRDMIGTTQPANGQDLSVSLLVD